MTNRTHPVRQLYEILAMGVSPEDVDFEDAGIPVNLRSVVRTDARAIQEHRTEGAFARHGAGSGAD